MNSVAENHPVQPQHDRESRGTAAAFNAAAVVLLGAILLLLGLVAASPAELKYDEPCHLELAEAVLRDGWCEALTSPSNRSAAGPLYPAIHLAVAPLTGLQAPYVRWLNPGLLGLVVLCLSLWRKAGPIKERFVTAASLLCVPFLWPCAGMALTEIPAMLPFTAFILLYCLALDQGAFQQQQSGKGLSLAAFAGVCLGLAVLGRQTHLALVPALFAPAIVRRESWKAALVAAAATLATSGWLFALWKDLVPPSQQATNGGMRFDHGLLSLSYVGAACFFLNPAWLIPNGAGGWVLAILGGGVASLLARDFNHPPAETLVNRLVGAGPGRWVGFVIGSVIMAIGLLWLWKMLMYVWHNRRDTKAVFLGSALLLMTAAPIKVSHLFSSRYVVGSIPLILIVTGFDLRKPSLAAARIMAGGLLGAATLYTYLF